MDTLESMQVFVRVVEHGSFAAAARSLALSPAMVTKHIAYLEGRTGTRLLNRTTRHLRMTDAGATYYERCVHILGQVSDAEAEASSDSKTPSGIVRLTAPTEFGNTHLAPILASFLQRHPTIELHLDLSNRAIDLVAEGYDVALRIARQLDTELVGRQIGRSRFHAVASPSYLERRGRPDRPQALSSHECLSFAVPSPWTQWRFEAGQECVEVVVRPRMLSTSSEALLQAAIAGVGVTLLPTFVCGPALGDGRLVSLFPNYDAGSLGVHVLYPRKHLMPARVRALVDHLVETISRPDDDPWAG